MVLFVKKNPDSSESRIRIVTGHTVASNGRLDIKNSLCEAQSPVESYRLPTTQQVRDRGMTCSSESSSPVTFRMEG